MQRKRKLKVPCLLHGSMSHGGGGDGTAGGDGGLLKRGGGGGGGGYESGVNIEIRMPRSQRTRIRPAIARMTFGGESRSSARFFVFCFAALALFLRRLFFSPIAGEAAAGAPVLSVSTRTAVSVLSSIDTSMVCI